MRVETWSDKGRTGCTGINRGEDGRAVEDWDQPV